MEGLNAAAAGLQRAANRLYSRMMKFEGADGTGTQYDIAVQDQRVAIYDEAISEGKRPPAEDIRAALAEKFVRENEPVLYSNWKKGKTEINALRIWISAMKQSISARQSILRGERD
jgi:hypothetical protein